MMIEAMADGGVEKGLPRDMAIRLAAQALAGSAEMVLQTGKHPAELKDSVCSPAGSTIVGVHALERGGFRTTDMNAVTERCDKMIEVGKKASAGVRPDAQSPGSLRVPGISARRRMAAAPSFVREEPF